MTVMSYDPRYCPVCRGSSAVSVRMVSGRPLGLVRVLPCPVHVDGRPLTALIDAVSPAPRSPQGDAA